jgi:hypothetical protein
VIAYFYLTDKHQPEDLVRSMVNQFSAQCKSTPNALVKLHDQCKPDNRQPAMKELISTLQWILQGFGHTYVVLDALDECMERMKLLDLIEEIMTWKLEKLHVLVTSRKEQAFSNRLPPLASGKFDIQNLILEDIRIYVWETLQHDPQFTKRKWLPRMQGEIEKTLIEHADGM